MEQHTPPIPWWAVDAQEIIAQLRSDPAPLAQLRAVLLTEELLQLPERVAHLEERLIESRARLVAGTGQLAADLRALEVQMVESNARLGSRQLEGTGGSGDIDTLLESVERRLERMG